jgi:hypothetical protein
VELFFTPIRNCAELGDIDQILSGNAQERMKIVPIATLSQAVSILRSPDTAQYPGCKSTS